MKKIELTLVDMKDDLPRYWSDTFRGLPVRIETGSIFDCRADAVVSPANSFGIMDGGLDGKLRNFFGKEIEDKVREKINNEYNGELLVGQAFATKTENEQFPYLITAPTMRVPSDVSDTINAYHAMCAILRVALQTDGIHSVVSSGLCSLSGGMPLKMVARQMAAAYEKVIHNKFNYPHWRHDRDFELYLKCKTDFLPDPSGP